jgi:hypothetical protein
MDYLMSISAKTGFAHFLPAAQECDATMPPQRTNAGTQKIKIIGLHPIMCAVFYSSNYM